MASLGCPDAALEFLQSHHLTMIWGRLPPAGLNQVDRLLRAHAPLDQRRGRQEHAATYAVLAVDQHAFPARELPGDPVGALAELFQ
jgi:hypothetical protein